MDCPVQSSAARAIFTIFSCAVVISGPKAAMTWSNFHLVMLELMSRAIAKVKIIVEMLQVHFFYSAMFDVSIHFQQFWSLLSLHTSDLVLFSVVMV